MPAVRRLVGYATFDPDTVYRVRQPGSTAWELVTFVPGPRAYDGEVTHGGFGIRLFEPRTGLEAAGRDFMATRAELHRLLLDREAELAASEADGLTDAEAEQLAHLRQYHRFLQT